MNATCERLIGTLRREFPGRVLFLGETHLRAVLTDHQAHYNTARPHQGIAQRVPADERDAHPATATDIDTRRIRRKPVLNGLINEYVRAVRRWRGDLSADLERAVPPRSAAMAVGWAGLGQAPLGWASRISNGPDNGHERDHASRVHQL